MSGSSGIEQFRLSALVFVFASLVPGYSGYLLVTDIHELALAGAYVVLAAAFYRRPDESVMARLRKPVPIPAAEPSDVTSDLPFGEKYLGGFTSGSMNKGGAGYGVYATDRRLFGVRSRRSAWGASELGVLLGKDLGGKTRSIGDLEQKHDFVLDKTEIAQLEILKSDLFNGYLLVRRKDGKPIKIRFRGRWEYEQVVELMRAFLPEAVSVKGDKGAKP